MVSERVRHLGQRGFSVAELAIVMAIIGIVAASMLPMLMNYWRAATVKAAAEELAAALNRGRQLAISQNQSVCIEVVGNQYRYRLNTCAGAIWAENAADANGLFTLSNNAILATNANPIFTFMGGAAPAATFTVTSGALTRNVVVSASGRVRLQ